MPAFRLRAFALASRLAARYRSHEQSGLLARIDPSLEQAPGQRSKRLLASPTTEQLVQRLLLSAVALLLINPFVLYALNGRLWLALLATAIGQGVVQLTYRSTRPSRVALGMNFLFLVSLFLYGDLIVTTQFPERVIDNPYALRLGYYFNKPFLRELYQEKEYSAEYRTNPQGYRISVTMDPGWTVDRVDWLFVGDSFTQGAQVAFEDLFSSRLYRRFPDKVVLNAGVSGFGLAQEYAFLKDEGLAHNPSIVFLQVCSFNDFMNVRPPRRSASDLLVYYSPFARLLLQDYKFQNPASLPLGRWAEPFYPTPEGNANYNVFYNETAAQKERDLQDFQQYLGRIHARVSEQGARLVVFLVPTKEQVNERYLAEVLDAFEITKDQLDLRRPNRLLVRQARMLGFEYVDLLPVFARHPEDVFFTYDEHLTPFGHELLAETLAGHLAGQGIHTNAAILSDEYAGDRYPRYSADGTLLSYQSPRDGNMELFLRETTAGTTTRLTVNDMDEGHPWPFADGRAVAFTEGDATSMLTEVVLMDLGSGSRVSLTRDENVFGAIPSVDSEGRRIVFAEWRADRKGMFSQPRLVLLDLLTGARVELTSGEYEAWRPVLTPDVKTVVYIQKVTDQFDLFAVDLATARVRQLTTTPYDEWDPVVSGDGRFVVYAAKADGNWDLFELDLIARDARRLTKTLGNEWDPAYAPNDRIVFAGEFGLFRGMYTIPRR